MRNTVRNFGAGEVQYPALNATSRNGEKNLYKNLPQQKNVVHLHRNFYIIVVQITDFIITRIGVASTIRIASQYVKVALQGKPRFFYLTNLLTF